MSGRQQQQQNQPPPPTSFSPSPPSGGGGDGCGNGDGPAPSSGDDGGAAPRLLPPPSLSQTDLRTDRRQILRRLSSTGGGSGRTSQHDRTLLRPPLVIGRDGRGDEIDDDDDGTVYIDGRFTQVTGPVAGRRRGEEEASVFPHDAGNDGLGSTAVGTIMSSVGTDGISTLTPGIPTTGSTAISSGIIDDENRMGATAATGSSSNSGNNTQRSSRGGGGLSALGATGSGRGGGGGRGGGPEEEGTSTVLMEQSTIGSFLMRAPWADGGGRGRGGPSVIGGGGGGASVMTGATGTTSAAFRVARNYDRLAYGEDERKIEERRRQLEMDREREEADEEAHHRRVVARAIREEEFGSSSSDDERADGLGRNAIQARQQQQRRSESTGWGGVGGGQRAPLHPPPPPSRRWSHQPQSYRSGLLSSSSRDGAMHRPPPPRRLSHQPAARPSLPVMEQREVMVAPAPVPGTGHHDRRLSSGTVRSSSHGLLSVPSVPQQQQLLPPAGPPPRSLVGGGASSVGRYSSGGGGSGSSVASHASTLLSSPRLQPQSSSSRFVHGRAEAPPPSKLSKHSSRPPLAPLDGDGGCGAAAELHETIDPVQLRRRKVVLMAYVLLATIVVGVFGRVAVTHKMGHYVDGAGVDGRVRSKKGGGGKGGSGGGEKGTDDRAAALRQVFADIIDPPDAFDDPASPQSQALEWLASKDGRIIEIPTNGVQTAKAVQRFALAVLYYATGGDGWADAHNFLSDLDECDWNTVDEQGYFSGAGQCGKDGLVTAVALWQNNLKGEVPGEIVMLERLAILSLYKNELGGQVTEKLAGLTDLHTLYLHNNQITGSLDFLCPLQIGNFRSDCSGDGGAGAAVVCSCCNVCCNSEKQCFQK